MTFLNFILELRRRLQDWHTKTGVPIVNLATDGCRWSYLQMIDKTNNAISELLNLIETYNRDLFDARFNSLLITSSGNTDANGILTFSDDTRNVYSAVSSVTPYVKLDPIKFNDSLPTKGRVDHYQFTFTIDSSRNKRVIIRPAAAVTLTYVALKVPTYGINDSATVLFIKGYEDIALQIAERMCRDEELNFERSAFLVKQYYAALGIMTGQ